MTDEEAVEVTLTELTATELKAILVAQRTVIQRLRDDKQEMCRRFYNLYRDMEEPNSIEVTLPKRGGVT